MGDEKYFKDGAIILAGAAATNGAGAMYLVAATTGAPIGAMILAGAVEQTGEAATNLVGAGAMTLATGTSADFVTTALNPLTASAV